MEAVAAVIEGFLITVSGLYIFYLSIDKILSDSRPGYLLESIIVMLISTVITLFLVLFLLYIAKKSHSLVIKADALHYKTDLLTNGGILLSLGVIAMTDWYIIDAVVGIVIALYIIYAAVGLIKEGMLMLLDVALEPEMVSKIVDVIESTDDVNSFHWLKTRRSGKDIFINVHLVFDHDISLLKAHQISDVVDANIKELDDNFNWIINIHLDPHDDS